MRKSEEFRGNEYSFANVKKIQSHKFFLALWDGVTKHTVMKTKSKSCKNVALRPHKILRKINLWGS